MSKCSFAGNANQNISKSGENAAPPEEPSDLGSDGVPRLSHSADEYLTASGVVCRGTPQLRPYRGPVQVTPGETYEVE